MSRIVIHFARFGPYHLSRIDSAQEVLASGGRDTIGIETGGGDDTYAWAVESRATAWRRVTVFPGEAAERIPAKRLYSGMKAALDRIRPDAVAIAGWGSADARACLDWCRKNGAMAIVMSETREADGHRVWWKEWIKSRFIRRFDAALVGARSHRDYLVKLGMPGGRVAFGYNVVDNGYFAGEAAKWRSRLSVVGCPKYFLASNRFIERKNLLRLIESYAAYVQLIGDTAAKDGPPPTDNGQQTTDHRQPTTRPWNLCLLGDGEQKPALLARCHELGLNVIETPPWGAEEKAEMRDADAGSSSQLSAFSVSAFPSPTVFFPGFRQIDELPRFYAHAGCFIHPALEEPWGLVINEAMACGLPVLSGGNVGAAEELVDDGVNGWKFDATNMGEMSGLMFKVSASGFPLSAFGAASARILEERCPTRAFGEGLAELLER